jgi:hypothetical protein
MISSIVVGLITGALSSLGVAIIFYLLGKRDATALQLQGHLSLVGITMERCDPTQKGPGRRGDDGLEPTSHWLGCMIGLLDRTGFGKTAAELQPIKKEMDDLLASFDVTDEAEKKRRKADWLDRIAKIHSRQG